jgi:hypothetical protein
MYDQVDELIGEYSKSEEVTKNTTKNMKESVSSMSGSLDLDNYEIEDELGSS